jgi:predicted nucleic acid-binding Zn ribbon protein
MTTNGSIDALVKRLVEHELQLMTASQLAKVKTRIDEIVRNDGLEHAVRSLRAAPGPPCVVCGGPIWRTRKGGRPPIVCGDRCRKERARRRRRKKTAAFPIPSQAARVIRRRQGVQL